MFGLRSIFAFLLLFGSGAHSTDLYDYQIKKTYFTMPDGVQLAVSLWMPQPKAANEKFPVLLEILPYRKDDMFYCRDFQLYDYFAKRGYVLAKVDVRGTGSSFGAYPPKEYDAQEIDDAVSLIDQLARQQWSNGSVGMWGISWSGFNSLMVAMRNPPALKAVISVDSSDDLFHDDVRIE